MAINNQLTVPSPPSTVDVASRILAYMAAQTGVLTDLIPGSIIRTLAESLGSVISINAVELQALALQAILFGGYSAFNVLPLTATYASGVIAFYTSANSPYPLAATNIDIPTGTLIQTSGGIQFSTIADTMLLAGSTNVTAAIQAVLPGTTGNVPASSITALITPLNTALYPLNSNSTAGGNNAETTQQTASRFANTVAALQLSSPQAIASSVIGVANGNEVVQYSSCFEPWLLQGSGPYTTGFTIFVDNGSGAASSALTNAVSTFINGTNPNYPNIGYRPAGVNYGVSAVGPVDVNVTVTFTSGNTNLSTQTINSLITNAVDSYFASLNFGIGAQLPFLSTQISNAIINDVEALSVEMALSSAPTTPVSAISIPATSRAILDILTITGS